MTNTTRGGWDPAPRDLARRGAVHGWTREYPAPEIVGYLFAWACIRDGDPPGRRELARVMGWTTWKARTVLERVDADWAAWAGGPPADRPAAAHVGPAPPASSKPRRPRSAQRSPSPRAGTPDSGNRPAAAQPPPSARPPEGVAHGVPEAPPPTLRPASAQSPPIARALPVQDKGQDSGQDPVPPSGGSRTGRPSSPPAVPVKRIWGDLNAFRCERVAGARPLTMSDKRRRALSARVRDHGEDGVKLVWRWALTADDKRAAFLRDGGYADPDTLFRASNFAGYLDRAQAWEASLGGAQRAARATNEAAAAGWDELVNGDD